MDQLFQQTLHILEATLEALEKHIPRPQRKPFKDGFVYRYAERSAHQALVQKLARVISGLYAARLLLEHGFLQEQAALHRILDELQEDVRFIAYGLINDRLTELHQRYLKAFYEEEFDNPDNPTRSTQKRPMVDRKKIRAYLASMEERALNPSDGVALSRTIYKTYSGFVHGASPQIMDMYVGYPPKFHVSGMLGTSRMDEHRRDLWNYFYRGILAFGFAAKAFRDESLFADILRYRDEFERRSGTNYGAQAQNDT